MVDEEDFTYVGQWWLPQNPDFRLAGTFSFSKRTGPRLDVSGNFPNNDLLDPWGTVILGETAHGESKTLYQAFRVESSWPAFEPTKGTSAFVASKAFIGWHFQTREDVRFSAIAFHPVHFDEWLRLQCLDIEFDEKGGFAAKYVAPETRVFTIADDLEIRIAFALTGPNRSTSLNALSFEQKAFIVIDRRQSEAQHFNSLGELISHLCNFLSLAIMAPIYPLEVIGFLPKGLLGDNSRSPRIRILLPFDDGSQRKGIHFSQMLFTYNAVSEKLGDLLKNWFTKRESLEPVFDLFFGVIHNPNTYPVQTFLSYAQALETYHIRTRSNEVDSPDVHRNRIKEILASVPTTHKSWLNEKIAFSNSPTLAQRLKDLVEFNKAPVTAMAGDIDTFIKRVKDSRNYYTHYDPSLQGRAETGSRLKSLSMVLGTMLEAILLAEAGFPLSEVREMQRSRRRFPSAWY